ncbi:DSPc-domain-containing protein [Mycena vitilis]|nr:DSPc-domain-containing protein [Mycena vitilis]
MIAFDSIPREEMEAMCTPMHRVLALTGALYLGSMAAVHDAALLHEHHIAHLVQVLEIPWMPQTPVANGDSTNRNGFACHRIDLEDRAGAALQPHLAGACDYIAHALGRGESVLVHCQQGVSRSAAIVIAYLIREQGLSYDAAAALVRQRRRCIKPNSGFVRTLREWEKECAGLAPPQASRESRAPLPSKSR